MVPVLVGVRVPWDQAMRVEARDLCRWVQIGGQPAAWPETQTPRIPKLLDPDVFPEHLPSGASKTRA